MFSNSKKWFLLGALAACIIVCSAVYRQPKVKGQTSPQSCPSCSPPTPQIVYTPLIDLKEASLSEINLNCRASQPIDVVPTFYTADGTPVVGETIHLNPAEMRFINVQSLIPADYRGGHHWGGMSLSYTGHLMEVWGQMTFHGTGGSVNSFFTVIDQPSSNERNAVWRMQKKDRATIALGNYSDMPVPAIITFANGDTEQLTVAPYGTEIITRNGPNDGDAESVTITSDGQAVRLFPMGFVSSGSNEFGSSIRFADTQNVAQPNLYATNFRLKNTTPSIVLKNTTASSITALPRFLPIAGETGGVVELPSVTIPAYGTTKLDLTPLTSAARTRNDLDSVSVQIISSGGNGSLIGAANFTNNTTGVSYDIPLRDSGLTRNSAGGYPIRLDSDYTTVYSVTNVGDQPGKFTMQINYNGGVYAMFPQELAPGASAVFDIRSIRDQQVPDSSGRVLPTDLTIGQIRWSIVGPGMNTRLIGRSEIISKSGKVSSSYSCPVCCWNSYYDGSVSPNLYSLDTGNTYQFVAMQRDRDCYGNIFSPYNVTANWYTTDETIATADYLGRVTGVEPGSTLVTAEWDVTTYFADIDAGCQEVIAPIEQSGDIVITPSVTISQIKAVGKNLTALIHVSVTPVPNNGEISLTLYPKSPATGSAKFTGSGGTNTNTRTITDTGDVEITGVTECSTKNCMRLEAAYTVNNNTTSLGSIDFTVISLTLSTRHGNTDQVSSDNAAKSEYQSRTNTMVLGGPQFSTGGTALTGWIIGIEIKATIFPSDFDQLLTLRRKFNSRTFFDQTLNKNYENCVDDSPDVVLDKDPQSGGSQGKVYDVDGPGINLADTVPSGTIARVRTNFKEWVTINQSNGASTGDVIVSPTLSWYERLSIKRNTGSGTSILNDVTNDNALNEGGTELTWNLTTSFTVVPVNTCPPH